MPTLDTPNPKSPPAVSCDICGSAKMLEIRCKIICRNCGTILQTCADL